MTLGNLLYVVEKIKIYSTPLEHLNFCGKLQSRKYSAKFLITLDLSQSCLARIRTKIETCRPQLVVLTSLRIMRDKIDSLAAFVGIRLLEHFVEVLERGVN